MANPNIFEQATRWEAQTRSESEKSAKIAWRVASVAVFGMLVLAVAIATMLPLRRTVPYVVRQDTTTGNVDILQPFDNRMIGTQELTDKYWARAYVLAREQYNWYLVGGDYDLVVRLTGDAIRGDYTGQFQGEKALDKVFGATTERRIKILSIAPAPTMKNQMVIRFERTTISRGIVVEAPTVFVINMTYQYAPKVTGAEADLIRNPLGYTVLAYRRDVEQAASAPVVAAGTTAAAPTADVIPGVQQ